MFKGIYDYVFGNMSSFLSSFASKKNVYQLQNLLLEFEPFMTLNWLNND